jgi:hypothetical protein
VVYKEDILMNTNEVSKSIAYCGLVCSLCHLTDQCDGCKSERNRCASSFSKSGCYHYNCCKAKEIDGCWECDDFPCNHDMFSDSHDVRIRAFVRCAKEEGKDKLAEYVVHNQKNGILYGINKDYDNLGSEEEVLNLLRTGSRITRG